MISFFKKLFWLSIFGGSVGALGVFGLYLYMTPQLPDVEQLKDVRLQTPMRVYTADQKLIGEYGDKKRTPLRYDQVPEPFIKAILAAEDDRFFEHPGVDIKGLARAATKLVSSGRIQGGGSTITMQVARNYLLTLDQTFTRKFKEILLSLQMEQELTKSEILELYINKIFLGKRAYGFEAAAQVYYGASLRDLTLSQWAMLAGLPKAPSALNPIANPQRALVRRNWILDRMLSLGYIDDVTHDQAKSQPITAKNHGITFDLYAPHVAEMVRAQMVEDLGREKAYNEGYRVYTTIDSKLQLAAQKAVEVGLREYDKRHGYRGAEAKLALTSESAEVQQSNWREQLADVPVVGGLLPAAVVDVTEKELLVMLASGERVLLSYDALKAWRPYVNEDRRAARVKSLTDMFSVGDLIRLASSEEGYQLAQIPAVQSALVSLDARSGGIKALVGGYSYSLSKFNRVVQGERQPGSSFKPFVYARALEESYTPATLINDSPVVFADAGLESIWRPENDGGKFLGPIRMRQALYQSRNLVSIRMMRELGAGRVINGLNRFGFNEDNMPRDLSLALGSHAVSPLTMAQGYSVFANGGYSVEAHLIDRVESAEGALVQANDHPYVCKDSAMPDEAIDLEALLQAEPEDSRCAERALEERVAFIIDDMLKDVVNLGTGRKALALKRSDLAGKTGTTNGPRDAWFSGYAYDQLVTTAWVGFDSNAKLGRNEYGGSAALPIWIQYMGEALKDKEQVSPNQPAGIVQLRIDPKTGDRVSGASSGVFEYFREENMPEEKRDSELITDPFTTDETLEELF